MAGFEGEGLFPEVARLERGYDSSPNAEELMALHFEEQHRAMGGAALFSVNRETGLIEGIE